MSRLIEISDITAAFTNLGKNLVMSRLIEITDITAAFTNLGKKPCHVKID